MTSFLITGPDGHVVLDGGYPDTAPMIMASIAMLGSNIADVEALVNSEPHTDHAGGLAALQQASGAESWASEASANVIASGGSYDRSRGLDFSDLPLDRTAPCPKRVPPWIPPRSDLFGPLE